MLRRYAWCVVAALLLGAWSASAQSTTGSISGAITDASKGVLPGATVDVVNMDTGVRRSIVTDADGRFRALSLPPGRYSVAAELSGFNKAEATGIQVQIGIDAPVNLTLGVGGVTESVTVQGEAAIVDLSAAVVGGVVTTRQISELPLNGRSFMQLATLQAGVSVSRTTERDFTGGFGGTQIAIAGARPEQTGYLLEGTNIADVSDKAPSSVAGVMLGVDTVQEFSVQTHGYSAEFGRAAGGIISAVTKSGTNTFRGSAFEFARNSAFDAKGFLDEGDDPPVFRRNQFGATLGGPIVRNSLFFFGSYEGLRERLGTTRFARFPNANAHRGLLPAAGGGLRQVAVHPTFRPYLDLLYPMPTGRDFGDGTAELAFAPTEPTDEDFLVGKIDWNLRSSDNLNVRVSSDRADNQVWTEHPNFTNVTATDTRYVTSQWQHIFSSGMLNEFRVADNRTARSTMPTPLIDIPKSLYIGAEYFGYIEVPGVLTTTGSPDDSAEYVQNLYQISDTFTANKGRQTIKTGFDYQRYHFDGVSNSRLGGNYRFRTLEEMLTLNRSATAQADRYTGVLPGTDTDRNMRQNYASFFVHDDFRMSDRLSLSLGLRYEFVTTPYELNGKVAGLLKLSDLESTANGITPGSPMFDNPSKGRGLAPRAGFSWKPAANDRTVVRGGAGVFYQPLTVSFYRGTSFRLYPYFAGVDIRQPAVFGPAILPVLAAGAGSAAVQKRSEFIAYDTEQPYSVQWHVNTQQELPGAMVAEIGYMGSRGVNLPFYGDPNTTPSEYGPDGVKRLVPGAGLRYPSWGRIRTRSTGAESEYHGLTVGLQKRLTHGVQFQGNYTYSRSTDTWSGGLQGSSDYLTGAGTAVDYWDIEFERGLSSFDVPHNFVFNAVYLLPGGDALTGWKRAIGSGWQLSGIAAISSGLPFHPLVGYDRAGDRQSDTDLQRPNWAPGKNPSNAIIGTAEQWFDPLAFTLPPVGTFGNVKRNELRGPNLRVVDFSIFKNQAVGSRQIQFRVEVFNLLNRVNLNPPSAPLLFRSDATRIAGAERITSLATPARQLQLGVKFLF